MNSDLPFTQPPEDPTRPERKPRAHRHEWVRYHAGDEVVEMRCLRCNVLADPARLRRGRTSRARGQYHEREWARRLGMRHTGNAHGPDDAMSDQGPAANAVFVGQAKSMVTARFPGWMANELDKLRGSGRIPILGILESSGTIRSRPPRRLIVIDEADWIALHGPIPDPP